MAIAKKKKKFWEVELPLINKTTQLYAFKKEDLNNRTIIYDLTRILKGKSTLMKFDVKANKENIKVTARELKLMRHIIKNALRKRTDYIEDSFRANAKDNELTIKPFLITRKRVARKVRKALRDKAKEEILNYIKNKKTEDIFKEILKKTFQRDLSLKLKKIYPLSFCDIRILRVEKPKQEIK